MDNQNIVSKLEKLQQMDGFIGAALVDSDSGMVLGSLGGNASINLEVASAGDTQVIRAKRKTMSNLGMSDEIEDVLVTTSKQYHLLRPLRSRSAVFFCLLLDRSRANLAMARMTLADTEKDLSF